MGLRDVNPYDPAITEQEAGTLLKMLAKRELYVRAGRSRDAHGAGTMIQILWSSLKDFPDTILSEWDRL